MTQDNHMHAYTRYTVYSGHSYPPYFFRRSTASLFSQYNIDQKLAKLVQIVQTGKFSPIVQIGKFLKTGLFNLYIIFIIYIYYRYWELRRSKILTWNFLRINFDSILYSYKFLQKCQSEGWELRSWWKVLWGNEWVIAQYIPTF